MDLKGKTAFVADLNGAFGRSIVDSLTRSGANVAAGVSPSVSDDPGMDGGFLAVAHDPSSAASWETALSRVERELGAVDFVINNPDLLLPGSVIDCATADWMKVTNAMTSAVMLGMRHSIPRLKARAAATIVNIASVGSDFGLGEYVSYAASGFAIRSMTRSAAMDCQMKKYPIRICCVVAGFPDEAPLNAISPEAVVAAEDVANAAVFLCSQQAAGITGTELFVDNGISVRPV